MRLAFPPNLFITIDKKTPSSVSSPSVGRVLDLTEESGGKEVLVIVTCKTANVFVNVVWGESSTHPDGDVAGDAE